MSCGEERRRSQAYTGRHRSASVCRSACGRVSAPRCACVLTSRKNHVNRAHTTTVIDMQMQIKCISSCGHTLHMEKYKHIYAVNEVLVPQNAFPNMQTICIGIPTLCVSERALVSVRACLLQETTMSIEHTPVMKSQR